MSSYNPYRQPLNSWPNMLSLGNQPKIPGQCKQNLRFINQESANSRNRYRLRRAFGNQLFNTSTSFNVSYIVFMNTSHFNIRSFNSTADQTSFNITGINISQNNQISQFNRSRTEFVFTVPQSFDLCANNIAQDLSRNYSDASFGNYIQQNFSPILDALDFSSSLPLTNITEVLFIDNLNDILHSILGNTRLITQTSDDITLSLSDNTGEFRSGLTPFRKAFNAGDMLTRNNSATSTLLPKAPNQVNSLRNMFGWQNNAGSVRQEENGSFYSGNPRFVYDGSDYARFKKLQAINRNYNDITFGGDQHSASQQAYRRVVQR